MPRTWKAPDRPAFKITQCFNDGMVRICTVTDGADPGRQPVEELATRITLRFEERKVGIQRHYDALQNQIRVERVIRVPHAGHVTTQDAVVDRDGRVYRIDLVQMVPDVYPQADDLTLVAFRQI